MTGAQPLRGEIWLTKTGTKTRPVIVISRDAMNHRLNKVLVIPGTTNLRGWPDEVSLEPGILKETTAFCCQKVTPIAIADLGKRAGVVPEARFGLSNTRNCFRLLEPFRLTLQIDPLGRLETKRPTFGTPGYRPAAARRSAVMALPSALPPESFMAAPTKKPAILGSPSLRR
jgi:mRNA-degrading endonuclease toxin of MazEF toxin-antitoxin module